MLFVASTGLYVRTNSLQMMFSLHNRLKNNYGTRKYLDFKTEN